MIEEIFVPLLDEGVEVWRPVPAWRVDASTYSVLRPASYDPDDEKWQYPPGSTVICQPKTIKDGTVLAAVQTKQLDRQTA